MKEVVLRFRAKDERTAKAVMQRFYDMCEKEKDVYGWGLISYEEE